LATAASAVPGQGIRDRQRRSLGRGLAALIGLSLGVRDDGTRTRSKNEIECLVQRITGQSRFREGRLGNKTP
jgi:hypothetical protein